MHTRGRRLIRACLLVGACALLVAVGAVVGARYERSQAPTAARPAAGPTPSPSPTPSPTPSPSASASPSPSGFSSGPPPGRDWSLAFHEEFDGDGYDDSLLTPCFDWNYGSCTKTFNNGREAFDPDQVSVADGVATLSAVPTEQTSSGCGNRTCSYKSGLLSTARPDANGGKDYLYKFTYGYVEARMKLPDVTGFASAFWMLPAEPSFKYRSEIDIVENLGGDPKTIFQTYHYADHSKELRLNKGDGHNGACAVRDYSTALHRYGVDWQPDAITFYIDGVACGRFTDADQIEDGPMQIIMMLSVDTDWPRSVGLGLKDPQARADLVIDYLRVYQVQ